ncbi:hypothetical protein K461DRAFT_74143 [Myriangium duriaei CBS 260.36]|uniref:Uncharacterized protein n=1 Tax=Myriangium duriaei CBS 260.36 TaxID=1168546 RepID=A0A9P4IPU7_9PEZI|nr:hypothetical protein K461DRAFT_74143 [Myriangium duriaei CBS 260.36]
MLAPQQPRKKSRLYQQVSFISFYCACHWSEFVHGRGCPSIRLEYAYVQSLCQTKARIYTHERINYHQVNSHESTNCSSSCLLFSPTFFLLYWSSHLKSHHSAVLFRLSWIFPIIHSIRFMTANHTASRMSTIRHNTSASLPTHPSTSTIRTHEPEDTVPIYIPAWLSRELDDSVSLLAPTILITPPDGLSRVMTDSTSSATTDTTPPPPLRTRAATTSLSRSVRTAVPTEPSTEPTTHLAPKPSPRRSRSDATYWHPTRSKWHVLPSPSSRAFPKTLETVPPSAVDEPHLFRRIVIDNAHVRTDYCFSTGRTRPGDEGWMSCCPGQEGELYRFDDGRYEAGSERYASRRGRWRTRVARRCVEGCLGTLMRHRQMYGCECGVESVAGRKEGSVPLWREREGRVVRVDGWREDGGEKNKENEEGPRGRQDSVIFRDIPMGSGEDILPTAIAKVEKIKPAKNSCKAGCARAKALAVVHSLVCGCDGLGKRKRWRFGKSRS